MAGQIKTVHQGQRGVVVDAFRKPINYEQLTSISGATGLTAAKFDGAHYAEIQAEGQDVRYRDDGTNPTTSVGMIIFAGQTKPYFGDLSTIKLIEVTATAKLNITYYQL